MKTIAYLIASLIISAPIGANAEPWSTGFSLGASDTSGFCDQYDRVTCDQNTDIAYKFFVGRDIGDHFRVEGFWSYLGSARVEDDVNIPDSATINVGGIGVSAMALAPITNRTDVFGSIGVMRTMIGEHRLERVNFMYESTSTSPAYSIGIQHYIGGQWTIRGEWQHFDIKAKTPLPINVVTIGLEIRF